MAYRKKIRRKRPAGSPRKRKAKRVNRKRLKRKHRSLPVRLAFLARRARNASASTRVRVQELLAKAGRRGEITLDQHRRLLASMSPNMEYVPYVGWVKKS